MSSDLQVTYIERQPRRKRLAAHLSDGRMLSLTADVAARFRLAAGTVVGADRLQQIADVQAREDAMTAAFRLIAFRPRSENEVRRALTRRAIPAALQDEVVSRLSELGLLDDRAFAASFVESRDGSSPRSRRLLAQELRQKGVTREIAAESTVGVDDADAAYRAAERRAGTMGALPYADFERRLGSFLLRRGFSYETTRATVRRLWQERPGDGEDERRT
ncbi:MAG TPA: RecX family transcriptional regulator [Dehalococcoidia bacterium]|nr:RecX family transcriptional regulator [Dehalococcoidia bacterium]